MNDNLNKMNSEFSKFKKSHKFCKFYHKIVNGEVELCYKQFYASPKMLSLELDLVKDFEKLDNESLEIIEKFIGD